MWLHQYNNDPYNYSSTTMSDNEVLIVDNGGGSVTEEACTVSASGSSSSFACAASASGSSSGFNNDNPSTSASSFLTVDETSNVDTLFSLFSEKFTTQQIQSVYNYSGDDFDASIECLGVGASLDSIVKVIMKHSRTLPVVKLHVDKDEMWSDLLSFYKCVSLPCKKRLRICLGGSSTIDTGGVRRQVYTTVYSDFVTNTHIRLFDGPENHVRPCYSAESRGSGIFKAWHDGWS